MDPSLEDSLSFWIKYKAMLTSERGVLATVTAVVAAIGCLMAAISKHRTIVRLLFCVGAVVNLMSTLLLLRGIPQKPDNLKRELQVILSANLLLFISAGIITAILGDTTMTSVLIQSFLTFQQSTMFLSSFWWLPRVTQKRELMIRASTDGVSRHSVLEVFQNVDEVMAFARHCTATMCVENVLAILEVAAFKKMIRGELVKDSPSLGAQLLGHLPLSPRRSDDALEFKPTLSNDASTKSIASSNSDNEALFIRARSLTATGGHVSERWSRWDQQVSVELSQFGCRSAIVSGTGDARSKALSLCEKYFEWDSEFSLNISYRNRSDVLALVGKDAAVALEPVVLLYAFDGAMDDVQRNLQDAMCQFQRKVRLSKSVLLEAEK